MDSGRSASHGPNLMLLSGNVGDESPAVFSLELGDELVQTRDWLHGFAESVIRPAAAEWDEREETPWPVLEEAAKIGLYSLDFYAQQYLEGSGLGIPVAFEELFWGDAGIGMSLVGSTLAMPPLVAQVFTPFSTHSSAAAS